MNGIRQQFVIFWNSTFGEKDKSRLFEWIWDHYHKKIMVFVGTFTKKTQVDIEDLSQEIMLKIYNSLHKYNPVYSFNTWIYTIARNHCLDYLRKSTNVHEDIYEARLSNELSIKNPEMKPDEKIVFEEMQGIANEYLENLDETKRQISFLRFYERLSYKKISSILEIPSGTIRHHVHSIREGLKHHMEKLYEL